jgi:hypothetical protein
LAAIHRTGQVDGAARNVIQAPKPQRPIVRYDLNDEE